MERRRPVMLVGSAGSGKSVLVGAKLASLDPEKYLVKNVPFNYYTTSAMLQGKQPQGPGVGVPKRLTGLLCFLGWAFVTHSTTSSLTPTHLCPCPQLLTLPPSVFLPAHYNLLNSIGVML